MMILGEVVLELAIPTYSYAVMGNVFEFSFFGLLLSFSFAVQYYDAVHRPMGAPHAMKRSAIHSFLFTWMHPVVGFCMLLVTVATTRMYNAIHEQQDDVSYGYRSFLAGACALVVGCLTVMRMMHKGLHNACSSFLYRFRLLFVLGHAMVMFSQLNYEYDLALHALLAMVLAAIDISASEIKRQDRVEQLEEEERSRHASSLLRAEDVQEVMRKSDLLSSSAVDDARCSTSSLVLEEGHRRSSLGAVRLSAEQLAQEGRVDGSSSSPRGSTATASSVTGVTGRVPSTSSSSARQRTLHHDLSMSDHFFARRHSESDFITHYSPMNS